MSWHATPADVLARDWYVIEEEKSAAPKDNSTNIANHAFVRRTVPLEAR